VLPSGSVAFAIPTLVYIAGSFAVRAISSSCFDELGSTKVAFVPFIPFTLIGHASSIGS